MAVFVELTTDAFEDNFKRLADRTSIRGRAGLSNVRRPLRGMEVKEDTYAMIKVIRADGKELFLIDSGSETGKSKKYSNFILQQVQEARMEKHQIVETFGESYIFFFGEAPRFLDVQAVLINSLDFNWRAEWWENWERRLRGTKSVELGARTYLFYDDLIVEGYMLLAQAVEASIEPFKVSLTFRMFVTSTRNINMVGDPDFPIRQSVYLPPGVDLTSKDAFKRLSAAYETESRNQVDWAQDELALAQFRSQTANAALSQARSEASAAALEEALGFGGATATEAEQNTAEARARALAAQAEAEAASAGLEGFGDARRLSTLMRAVPRSVLLPSSQYKALNSLRHGEGPMGRNELDFLDLNNRTKPLREKIAANKDEWTGNNDISLSLLRDDLPEVYNSSIRTNEEVADLFKSALIELNCRGADINSYSAFAGLGMGVSFGAGAGIGIGAGAGIGAGVGAGATFGATAKAGVGAGGFAGAGYGFGAGAGFTSGAYAGAGTFGSAGAFAGMSANGFSSAGAFASASARASARNGSDVFFGGSSSARASATSGSAGSFAFAGAGWSASDGFSSSSGSGTFSEFGDAEYGYNSPFGGPGYGKAGFGDYGGKGYGSGFGEEGDPGFLPPDEFDFEGTDDPDSGFQTFAFAGAGAGYGTGFGGVGAGDSFAGAGAGAAVAVGGSISAFAMASVDGTLDPNGQTPVDDGLQPFGVSCPAPPGLIPLF